MSNLPDDKVLDKLFDFIDDLFLAERFDEVDEVLKNYDVEKLQDVVLVGILVATLPAKSKLPHREAFMNRVSEKLFKNYPSQKEVDEVLQGLD